jgi:hypothetical protein
LGKEACCENKFFVRCRTEPRLRQRVGDSFFPPIAKGLNMEKYPLKNITNGKGSLMASRRSFLAGSRLLVGAGAALALGLHSRTAMAGNGNDPGQPGTNGCGPSGGTPPKCCFLPGTRIATPAGEVKIEELRIGDSVSTASGEIKPVKWVGKRQFQRASDPGAAPVKISRFAIDGEAPLADLYVSPAHAIYIDGVLIPAQNLVNGVTIVANAKPEMLTLTYYHVELDTHEAILAEGLAVETFLGNDRGSFDNADEYVALYGSLRD